MRPPARASFSAKPGKEVSTGATSRMVTGPAGDRSCDRKCHGDAMIPMALDLSAAELAAFDVGAVFRFLDADAERLEARCHCGDTVAFLNA